MTMSPPLILKKKKNTILNTRKTKITHGRSSRAVCSASNVTKIITRESSIGRVRKSNGMEASHTCAGRIRKRVYEGRVLFIFFHLSQTSRCTRCTRVRVRVRKSQPRPRGRRIKRREKIKTYTEEIIFTNREIGFRSREEVEKRGSRAAVRTTTTATATCGGGERDIYICVLRVYVRYVRSRVCCRCVRDDKNTVFRETAPCARVRGAFDKKINPADVNEFPFSPRRPVRPLKNARACVCGYFQIPYGGQSFVDNALWRCQVADPARRLRK